MVRRTTQDEIATMRDLDSWPWFPILPIKRSVPEGDLECATMRARDWDSVEPVVYMCDLFSDVTDRTDVIEYESFEELVSDGWVVD